MLQYCISDRGVTPTLMFRQVKRSWNISGVALRPNESASRMQIITSHPTENLLYVQYQLLQHHTNTERNSNADNGINPEYRPGILKSLPRTE